MEVDLHLFDYLSTKGLDILLVRDLVDLYSFSDAYESPGVLNPTGRLQERRYEAKDAIVKP